MELNAASSSTNSTKKGGCNDDCKLNNDEIKSLINSIEKEQREANHSLQSKYSIFRVHERLRKLKPQAYTPQSVSIGLLHSNEEHLQLMQAHKLRYLNRFLVRHRERTLDACVEAMSELGEKARKCYSETTGKGFQKDKFVKMLVIDGCFILEILKILKTKEKDDLVSNRSWFWELLPDLINLEKQLPFFVLEHLYSLTWKLQTPSTFNQSQNLYGLHYLNTFSHDIYGNLLIWYGKGLHGPSSPKELKSIPLLEGEAKHFLDLLRIVLLNSYMRKRKSGTKGLARTSCAMELRRAGIKFLRGSSPSDSSEISLFDITFSNGKLTIPPIAISDSTIHTLRNLIAFEQGREDISDYFTAYSAFMDGLIDTQSDVELLVKKGIIENHLGNPEEVVTLFNNIVKHARINDPCFSGLIEDVGRYQNKTWNRWKAVLKQTYFKNPWALISLLAAVFVIILTVVQTICSILQVV